MKIYLSMLLVLSIQLLSLWQKKYIITMGNPTSCEPDLSICTIEKGVSTNNNKQSSCFIDKEEEKLLSIKFLKSEITEQFYFNYISTGYFKVGLDFPLSHDLMDELNLSYGVIKTGKYPITETGISYEILVHLK
ncbi:MAG: hypothetical protein MUC81_11335 [Bacteroidia bacterium]|nr:hypothetical protein [Bacteroidia bacterium]